jgi:hypothetical protein
MSNKSQWEQFHEPKKERYFSIGKRENKLTVVLYKGEIHVIGKPDDMEVVVMNLDKEIENETISDGE